MFQVLTFLFYLNFKCKRIVLLSFSFGYPILFVSYLICLVLLSSNSGEQILCDDDTEFWLDSFSLKTTVGLKN